MNVFELSAALTLDRSQFDEGLDSAKGGLSSVASALGNGLATAAKVGAAAIAATSAVVMKFASDAVSAYAEYEQLVGGVSKLYGTAGQSIEEYAESVGKSVSEVESEYNALNEAQNMVFENAKNAYKTAGMSANEYMATATSFSAALINSLNGDTVEAARLTDVAMSAMSDNINTFGTDAESVQNAFNGFSKANFTMLDNLKLGYGGTKEEMQRLIDDANTYRASIGQTSDLTIDSFSDIVQAIQSIQEKQNIAGTTAREAMTTIEGSAAATKAAWQNVITAIGSGEGLEGAFDGLINSLFGEGEGEGLLNQVIPRIQVVMEGISNFVSTSAPYLAEAIPALLESVVPSLMSSVITLLGTIGQILVDNSGTLVAEVLNLVQTIFNSIVEATNTEGPNTVLLVLQSIIDALTSNLPMILDSGVQILVNLIEGILSTLPSLADAAITIIEDLANSIANALPELIPVAVETLMTIVETLIEHVDSVIDAAINIVMALADGILDSLPILIEKLPTIIDNLVTTIIENVPKLLQAAAAIITQLTQGILQYLPQLLVQLPTIIQSVVSTLLDNIPLIIDVAITLIETLATGILDALPDLLVQLPTIIIDTVQTLLDNVPKLIEVALSIITQLTTSIFEFLPELISRLPEIIIALVTTLIENVPKLLEVAAEIISTLIGGILDGIGAIIEMGASLVTNIIDGIGSAFSSLIEIGGTIISKVGEGFTGTISSALDWGKDLVSNFIDGIKEKWEALKDTVKGVANSVKDFLGFSEPKEGPLSNFHTYAPDMMQLFAQGIKENESVVTDQIAKSFDFGEQLTDVNVDATVKTKRSANGESEDGEAVAEGGIVQNITINSPTELNPAEVARQTKNASRTMMLTARGVA